MQILRDDEIEAFTEVFANCLLYAYSPNCQHCKNFEDQIEAIGLRHLGFPLRKVNVFEAPKFCDLIKLPAVPYLAIFQHGKFVGGGSTGNVEAIEALIRYLS